MGTTHIAHQISEGQKKGKGRFQLRDIVVDFGPNRALDHVNLTLEPGEIVGLLGHNGAGKSTIVNIASGAFPWTSGEVLLDGAEVPHGSSPRQIAERGVTVIHQEPSLVPTLSIFSNMCLGKHFQISVTRKRKRELVKKALEQLDIRTDIDAPVSVLSLGQRQMVDLARGSLSGDTSVLLLDEPTAALGMTEVEHLHGLIRDYAKRGAAVIYISHRLPDVLDVCQRVVVLNKGRLVLDRSTDGLNVEDLSQALAPGIHVVEKTNNLQSVDDSHGQYLRMHSRSGDMHAGKGEVVGLFGMAGGEQFMIVQSLFGIAGYLDSIILDGKPYTPSGPKDAIRRQVAYVPQDRDVDGLIMNFPAKTNVLLPWYKKLGGTWWLPPKFHDDIYEESRKRLQVLGPSGNVPISQFSGGNRQKQLLARWMFPSPANLLVLSQPTQGVDVGAKMDIVNAVRQEAANGACVIVASSENDEITRMCDRAYVVLGDHSRELDSESLSDTSLLSTLLSLADEYHHRPTQDLKPGTKN